MSTPRIFAALSLLALVLGLPALARGDEPDEDEAAAYAVQNREFTLGHELFAAVGVLPINAYVKGLTVGGGYTYHFNDLWAWEVGQFSYVYNIDTDLKKELLQNFQVLPTQIEQIDYFFGSALEWKPLYGKFAWLNRKVAHASIFLVLGGAVGKYRNPSEFRPAFQAGGGLQLHIGRVLSLRLDARDYGFFKGYSPTNELHIALVAALSFGGGK
jgi:outer membrane beta-barrel protein